MNISSLSNYNFNSTYSVKLNESETLIYEDDTRFEQKSPYEKKIKEEQEAKQTQQSEKEKKSNELDAQEMQQVKELQARDIEVRAHEAAHQAAGAGMTGAASFTYQQGPDGRMYAIGGEVSISMPTGSTPQETIANARKVAAAAMAASDPSPQDYSVAASARVMEMKAQQQLAKQQQEEFAGKEIYSNSQKDKKEDTPIENLFDISA